jgi:hypothetical protein
MAGVSDDELTGGDSEHLTVAASAEVAQAGRSYSVASVSTRTCVTSEVTRRMSSNAISIRKPI